MQYCTKACTGEAQNILSCEDLNISGKLDENELRAVQGYELQCQSNSIQDKYKNTK